MKQIAVLLALLVLFCACQPTPEQDAVKQKDTNVLIDTIKTEQQKQQQATGTLPDVREKFPARFTCDFTTSVQNVHVISDAPLDILTDGVFPSLRAERRTLTEKERMTVVQRIMNSEELYIFEEHVTRKDLEKWIRDLMREPSPEEKEEWMREVGGTEEEWQEMMQRRKEMAAEYQERYNELPDDDSRAPLQRWDGSAPKYEGEENGNYVYDIVSDPMPEGYRSQQAYASIYYNEMDRPIEYRVASRGDYDAPNVFFFDHAHKFGTVRIDRADFDTPHEGAAITPNDAIRIAQSYFEGICDFCVSDVYWANNAATDGDVKGVNEQTRWAYLIHFSHNYNGAYSPYCKSFQMDHNAEADYVRVWQYESMMAAVDGDGNLISLVWQAPMKVTDTIAESTPLLPYEEIQRIFETQMNRMFAYDEANGATLTLDYVQLGLFRIREQNDLEHGLLIPAWFFTGYLENSDAHRGEYGDGMYYDNLNPLLIINAVDGSIIDPMKGY